MLVGGDWRSFVQVIDGGYGSARYYRGCLQCQQNRYWNRV